MTCGKWQLYGHLNHTEIEFIIGTLQRQ